MIIVRQPDPPDADHAVYHLHLSPADLRELEAGGAAQADALLPFSTARDGNAEFVLYGGETPVGNHTVPGDPSTAHRPTHERRAHRSTVWLSRDPDPEQRPGRPRQSHHTVRLYGDDLRDVTSFGHALSLGVRPVDIQNPHYHVTVTVRR